MTPFAPLEIKGRRRVTAANGSLSLTGFAKKVYKVVLAIKPGEVRSYKWVARKSGRPRAWRAVGQALKNNPYPLVIPCHRVVRSNQDCGGYVFGARAKEELLALEKEIKEWGIKSRK